MPLPPELDADKLLNSEYPPDTPLGVARRAFVNRANSAGVKIRVRFEYADGSGEIPDDMPLSMVRSLSRLGRLAVGISIGDEGGMLAETV